MTGVLRTHRGRGVSLALKLLAIDFARRAGVPVLRTFHHQANDAAIAMNRRLGFVDEPPTPAPAQPAQSPVETSSEASRP